VADDLKTIVAEAITAWNDDPEGRDWAHSGQGETAEGCRSWQEGLHCCTDPDHPEFDTLVEAIVAKLEPLAGALGGLERLMGALRDIADIDTDPHSPNSVNWRATLLYATQRAQQALEPYGATTRG
jgi:hypothetical protein